MIKRRRNGKITDKIAGRGRGKMKKRLRAKDGRG